tara:strand:- start:534 stop:1016 length:483 start_codon:yes stop_codon:yes gene_type:complete
MARITVEDCIDKFPSRFELVLVASNRARKLYTGENPTVEIDNDKNTVIALREIAEETLTRDQLKNDLIEEYQTTTFSEDEDLNEIEDNSDASQSETNELDTNEIKKDDYSEQSQPAQKELDANDTHQDIENDNRSLEETSIDTSSDNSENSLDEDKVQEL